MPSRAADASSGPVRAMLCALAVCVLALSGCAGRASRQMPARSQELITTQEISALNVNNAYDAVLQLRPMWLASRGRRSARVPTEIVVAHNNAYFGPVSSLRTFEIESVKELRYLDSAQATAFLSGLGSRQVEGAIVVVVR